MGNSFSHFGFIQSELSTSPQPGFLKRSQRLWALWATRPPTSSSSLQRRTSARFELESDAIDTTQLHRSEVGLGIAIVIFQQANHFAGQRFGNKNQLALPFNLAVAAHSAQFEVAGVRRILEARRIGSRRGRVNCCRYRLAQGFVWALMIKLCAEVIEAALLGREAGRRRLGGFGLERLVHPFMPPVLLGFAGYDSHRRNTKLDPPHRQSAQAAGGERGERRTIIGEQYLRQAALAKEPLQFTAAAVIAGVIARQHNR